MKKYAKILNAELGLAKGIRQVVRVETTLGVFFVWESKAFGAILNAKRIIITKAKNDWLIGWRLIK